MVKARKCALVACVVAAALTPIARCDAQGGAKKPEPPPGLLASRAALVTAARAADSLKRTADAARFRARLSEGDFTEGDRVVLFVQILQLPDARGATAQQLAVAPETLFVAPGRFLQFPRYPQLGALSVAGVLRSELDDRVHRHFVTLYRETEVSVHAISMVRLGAQGQVGKSSYFFVPPYAKLSDLIQVAGGFGGQANTEKITVRRGTTVVLNEAAVREALVAGTSIDALSLRDGDEMVVAVKVARNWMQFLQLGLSIVGIAVGLSRN